MPLLEKEYRNAAQRLAATQEELTDLAPERLKEKVSGGDTCQGAKSQESSPEPQFRMSGEARAGHVFRVWSSGYNRSWSSGEMC